MVHQNTSLSQWIKISVGVGSFSSKSLSMITEMTIARLSEVGGLVVEIIPWPQSLVLSLVDLSLTAKLVFHSAKSRMFI